MTTGMASYAAALKVRDHARAQLEAAEQSVFAAEPEYVRQARIDLDRAERIESDSLNLFTKELKTVSRQELRIYYLYRATLANKFHTDRKLEELKLAFTKSFEEARGTNSPSAVAP